MNDPQYNAFLLRIRRLERERAYSFSFAAPGDATLVLLNDQDPEEAQEAPYVIRPRWLSSMRDWLSHPLIDTRKAA
jgi:hypothetical protein